MEFVKGLFFFLKGSHWEVTPGSSGVRLYPLIAGDPGSVPGWGIQIQQTKQHSQKKTKGKEEILSAIARCGEL